MQKTDTTVEKQTIYIEDEKHTIRLEETYSGTILLCQKYFFANHENPTTFHRADGPAILDFYNNVCILEAWYYEGKKHRIDGPAQIKRDYMGRLVYEKWVVDDKLKKIIFYYYEPFGQTMYHYGPNNTPHCLNGPAVIHFNKNKKPHFYDYCIDGNNVNDIVKPWLKECKFPPWTKWREEHHMMLKLFMSNIT